MIKQLLMGVAVFSTLLTGAQTASEKSVIHISGDAELKVSPDVVVFHVNVFATDKQINTTVKKLNDETASLITLMEKMGFSKEQMRIAGFSVQQEWEYTGNKSIPKGYRAQQNITLRFEADRDKLARLMEAFAAEGRRQFNTFFNAELSDKMKRESEQKLITLAMTRAKENAELIAKNSGQRIVRIRQVNYHTDQQTIYPMPMQERAAMNVMMDAKASESAFQQISLEEMVLSERILIMFETEPAK
jgi:uncharacterized protein YggE